MTSKTGKAQDFLLFKYNNGATALDFPIWKPVYW